jgi:uncharacterized protein (TIGR03083 family)
MDLNSLGQGREEVVEAFADAASWFVELASTGMDSLDRPGLGEWTVRDLIGHTSRALSTVEAYLTTEQAPVEVATATGYFAVAMQADPDAIAARGRQAGADLGPAPSAAIEKLARRVVALVRDQPGEARLRTLAGTMTLLEYLPTRTFELTVHGCDLAVALGLGPAPPAAAARSAARLAGEITVAQGSTAAVLHALTGRAALPPGFTLV